MVKLDILPRHETKSFPHVWPEVRAAEVTSTRMPILETK